MYTNNEHKVINPLNPKLNSSVCCACIFTHLQCYCAHILITWLLIRSYTLLAVLPRGLGYLSIYLWQGPMVDTCKCCRYHLKWTLKFAFSTGVHLPPPDLGCPNFRGFVELGRSTVLSTFWCSCSGGFNSWPWPSLPPTCCSPSWGLGRLYARGSLSMSTLDGGDGSYQLTPPPPNPPRASL